MKDLIEKVIKFRDERNWNQFHTPENLSKSIVLEAAELLENFQWNNDYNLVNVKEELADIFIYSILLADQLKVDLVDIAKDKLAINKKKYPIDKSYGKAKKYNELK
jgi:NTP pyrophosphatase (non-canonical NTP hydrolase)